MPKKQKNHHLVVGRAEVIEEICTVPNVKTQECSGNIATKLLEMQCLLDGDSLKVVEIAKKIKEINLLIKQGEILKDDLCNICEYFIAFKYDTPCKNAWKSCLQNAQGHETPLILSQSLSRYLKFDKQNMSHAIETIQSCFENFEVGKDAISLMTEIVLECLRKALTKKLDSKRKLLDDEIIHLTFTIKCTCAVIQLCRSRQIKKINDFKSLLKTSYSVFFQDKLLGDCWQANGLLIAALLCVNNETKQELAEAIISFFDDEHTYKNMSISTFHPYAKLCFINGILSIADSNVLGISRTKKEVLLSFLHQNLKTIETDIVSVQEDVMLCRTYLQLSSVLCKSTKVFPEEIVSEIATYFYNFAYLKLDHITDAIRHSAKQLMTNALLVISLNNDHLSSILKSVAMENWHKRSTFVILSLIIQHVSTDRIYKAMPDLITILLQAMSDQSLVPYSCEVYHKLAIQTLTQKDRAIHYHEYLHPVLHMLSRASQRHCSLIIEYLFPKLLKLYNGVNCIENVISYFMDKEEQHNSQDKGECFGPFASLMMCLRTAHSMGLLVSNSKASFASGENMWNKLLDGNMFQQSLIHVNDKVRLMTFSLICESHKTSSLVTASDLRLFMFGIKYNLNNQYPAFRQQLANYFKKLLIRLQDNMITVSKVIKKSGSEEYESFLETYKDFLESITRFCLCELSPDVPYTKRITLLLLLELIHDVILISEHKQMAYHFLYNPNSVKLFCELFCDNFDDIVQISFKLITSPGAVELVKKLINEDQLDVEKQINVARVCTQPEKCRHASYHILFILSIETEEKLTGENLLKRMLKVLREDIMVAKRSIYKAAASSPMYGLLRCIRLLFLHLLKRKISEDGTRILLRSLITETILICFDLSEVVMPIVCSVSPEGYLPLSDADDVSQDIKLLKLSHDACGEENNRKIAQRVLVCCWRSVKETSLLLQEVTSQLVTVDTSRVTCDRLLSWEQLLSVGNHLKKQLLSSRHRGAFELAYSAFRNFCPRLWSSPHSELNQVPFHWLTDMLSTIQDPIKSKDLCATRRSAGLPFFIQALLSDKGPSCKAHFSLAMTTFIGICENSTDVEARVHSLNIVRALMKDTTLGGDVLPFLSKCTQLAITGFGASIWSLRNASTLLFAALFNRIFGVKQDKGSESAKKKKLSSYEFFNKLAGMKEYLLKKLEEICFQTEQGRTIQPLLHPILLLFTRIHTSPIHKNAIIPFVSLIIRCGATSVYKTRVASADALSSLLSHDMVSMVTLQLLESLECESIGQNKMHACLLQLNKIIVTYLANKNGVQNEQTMWNIINHMLKYKHRFSSGSNKCAITRSEYFNMYEKICECARKNEKDVLLNEKDLKSFKELKLIELILHEIGINYLHNDEPEKNLGSSILSQSFATILFQDGAVGQINSRNQLNIEFIEDILKLSFCDEIKIEVLRKTTEHIHRDPLVLQDCCGKLQDLLTLHISLNNTPLLINAFLNLLGNLKLKYNPTLLSFLNDLSMRDYLQIDSTHLNALALCQARLIKHILDENKEFGNHLIHQFLTHIDMLIDPLQMTPDQRLSAAMTFDICIVELLTRQPLKDCFQQWLICFQLLTDENEEVRQVASKFTHRLAAKSNLKTCGHPCVDTLAVRQMLCVLLVTLETHHQEPAIKIVDALENGLKAKNYLNQDAVIAPTNEGESLFEQSEINSHLDMKMISKLCGTARDVLKRRDRKIENESWEGVLHEFVFDE